ncbi:SelB-II domain-containing translation elongation factor [Candidatus Mancarchaeum acidiphilum]|uniref:SelB-II domain-containing translation elongation factor n=2 Tax=Candidatus Mancarchaeum acidiphilum TaxID=1920749 RepID=A0A218NNB2_9ARCH|nr:SelB-II domain-containing translation elongation factor [Candidatus Mancarchaeum acidiphilum]
MTNHNHPGSPHHLQVGGCHLISIPINNGVADFIGKKGAEDSLVYYNRIYNDDTIVAISPANLDDKFYGLAESITLSHIIVIDAKSIDKQLGEVLIATALAGKPTIIIEHDTIDQSQLEGMLKQLNLPNYTTCKMEDILGKIASYKLDSNDASGQCRVDIDRSFNVKGAGTVVLGIVRKGSVKVHDKLLGKDSKEVIVRSIQSQDRDIQEAGVSTRVGLALKGADSDEFKKGDTLSNYKIDPKKSITATINVSSINKEDVKEKSSYIFVSGFSYTSATVSSFDGKSISLVFDKPLCIESSDSFMLIRKQEPRIFAFGKAD